MRLEELIKLLGAVGIGSIITAVGAFIQSIKKNQLDYIAKERSEWRKDIKKSIACLLSGEKEKQLAAVNRIKTLINAYGKNRKSKYTKSYYMSDGHIWDLLEEFDFSKERIELLTTYLTLLVKYDWEDSKEVIKYNVYNLLVKLINVILILVMLVVMIRDGSKQVYLKGWGLSLLLFDFIAYLILIFQNDVIKIWRDNQTVRKPSFFKLFIITIVLPEVYVICRLLCPNKILIVVIVVVLLTEYSLLKYLYSSDDNYIQKIRELSETKEVDKEYENIINEVNQLESKIIYGDYSTIGCKNQIQSVKERRTKIIKLLRKETRPKHYFLKQLFKISRHPVHFIRRRKLRKKRKLKRRT